MLFLTCVWCTCFSRVIILAIFGHLRLSVVWIRPISVSFLIRTSGKVWISHYDSQAGSTSLDWKAVDTTKNKDFVNVPVLSYLFNTTSLVDFSRYLLFSPLGLGLSTLESTRLPPLLIFSLTGPWHVCSCWHATKIIVPFLSLYCPVKSHGNVNVANN